MPDSLPALETVRAQLLRRITTCGDMRRGSISAFTRKCGRANCHCAQSRDAGHGPQYRLTRSVKGKTVTETFSDAAARRKAQREVSEFHRFQQWSRELIEVNEKICRLRPVAEEDEQPGSVRPQEKKRPRRSNTKSPKK